MTNKPPQPNTEYHSLFAAFEADCMNTSIDDEIIMSKAYQLGIEATRHIIAIHRPELAQKYKL
jgi:hypothetical protein